MSMSSDSIWEGEIPLIFLVSSSKYLVNVLFCFGFDFIFIIVFCPLTVSSYDSFHSGTRHSGQSRSMLLGHGQPYLTQTIPFGRTVLYWQYQQLMWLIHVTSTHTFLRDFFALRFLPQPISRGLCKPVIVIVGHTDILLSWNHLGSSHLSKLYSSLRYHRCSCHFHSTSPQVFPDWQGVGLLVPSHCPRICPLQSAPYHSFLFLLTSLSPRVIYNFQALSEVNRTLVSQCRMLFPTDPHTFMGFFILPQKQKMTSTGAALGRQIIYPFAFSVLTEAVHRVPVHSVHMCVGGRGRDTNFFACTIVKIILSFLRKQSRGKEVTGKKHQLSKRKKMLMCTLPFSPSNCNTDP